MNLTKEQREKILICQQNELTESLIYTHLARKERNEENRNVLMRIAKDELRHAEILRKYTQQIATPNKKRILLYRVLSAIFGITFTIKQMEKGEGNAEKTYREFEQIPELQQIALEEDAHEKDLINLLNEERLNYMGSIVLGLNDALVEFTGALAGFTLALQNPKLIALTGAITGIAAALSMASSEYLSTKMEDTGDKHALKASIYTGIAYIFTVSALVVPFMLFENIFMALGCTLGAAIGIIALFNYYYSVVKEEPFKRRFLEMAALSMGVAFVSFIIGYLLKLLIGIEI